jgi:hypothetical protein
MDIVGELLHSSPAEVGELLCGLLVGAIVLSTMALSLSFRRLAFVAMSAVLLYLIVTQGPPGVESLGEHLLAAARQYEFFVKGVVAGKLLVGILWQFKPSASGGSQ